jgi:hypothetical protein
MAGIAKEDTPIEKMYIFTSKQMTFWSSGDIILNPYAKNI